MCLILQGARFQVQVLKPCKSVQESSEKVLDFKAQQLAWQIESTIVIDIVPFQPERQEFFVRICKPVPEYPTFHLRSDFGLFRAIPVIPDNFGQFQPRCKFRPVQDLACY